MTAQVEATLPLLSLQDDWEQNVRTPASLVLQQRRIPVAACKRCREDLLRIW